MSILILDLMHLVGSVNNCFVLYLALRRMGLNVSFSLSVSRSFIFPSFLLC